MHTYRMILAPGTTRNQIADRMVSVAEHADAWGVAVVSLEFKPTGCTVIFASALTEEQAAHLGLESV